MDFDIRKTLGNRSFGIIYEAREQNANHPVALKLVTRPKNLRNIKREVVNHCKLSHLNIVEMYGYFREQDKFYMVLEHATGGNLFDSLRSQPQNRFDEVR
jgi:serine/threonine protein kinase